MSHTLLLVQLYFVMRGFFVYCREELGSTAWGWGVVVRTTPPVAVSKYCHQPLPGCNITPVWVPDECRTTKTIA